MRTAADVLVTVELFHDHFAASVIAVALTLPTHIVTDVERRRAVAYPEDWIPRYSDAYRIELQEWIDSIAKGRPSTLATAHDGLRASLVADALVESMRTNGSWVKVPD